MAVAAVQPLVVAAVAVLELLALRVLLEHHKHYQAQVVLAEHFPVLLKQEQPVVQEVVEEVGVLVAGQVVQHHQLQVLFSYKVQLVQ